jgi:putative NADH-flavin reductase
MKIVVFGASGKIGQVIVREALDRGHEVTAAVRDPQRIAQRHHRLRVRLAQIDDADSVAETVTGSDAVIDSVGGLGHANPRISIECAGPLIDGMRRAGVRRLLVVGTAGTLEVAPGQMRMAQPDFPDVLRGEAQAQLELQQFLRELPPDALEWTYFSPPALIEPGRRTGEITLGSDQLPRNAAGESYISNEDYAVAAIDELERPQHIRRRFTAVSER